MGDPSKFCNLMDLWAKLTATADSNESSLISFGDEFTFKQAWSRVRLAIEKSCLLDRMMYHDEQPSQTPCPVHKGVWSGIHWGWPGSERVEPHLQEWYNQGCRCYSHTCGCTTGWQPDEHCGCLPRLAEKGIKL